MNGKFSLLIEIREEFLLQLTKSICSCISDSVLDFVSRSKAWPFPHLLARIRLISQWIYVKMAWLGSLVQQQSHLLYLVYQKLKLLTYSKCMGTMRCNIIVFFVFFVLFCFIKTKSYLFSFGSVAHLINYTVFCYSVKQTGKSSLLDIVIGVLKEPMFFLLLLCSTLYFLLGEHDEAIMLISFVLVIITISVYQERRTERALESLKSLICPQARVIRDGLCKFSFFCYSSNGM